MFSLCVFGVCLWQVDSDGSGHITVDELGEALKKCNIDLPGYQIRDLIVQYDTSIKDGKLEMEEFKQVRQCVRRSVRHANLGR